MEAIAISPVVAARLGIDTREETIETRFPLGFSKSLAMGRIASFEIGGLRSGPMDIGVLAALEELGTKLGACVGGNVGYHFLKDYAVTLDFERSLLTLSTDGPDGPC